MLKFHELGRFLYSIGVSYHAEGAIKNGRKTVARYLKCDKINETQKELIVAANKNITFANVAKTFAPELIKPIVVLRTDAQLKRENVK